MKILNIFMIIILGAKDSVYAIGYRGTYKAYLRAVVPTGTITKTVSGDTITTQRNDYREVRMTHGPLDTPLSHIDSFWFSWVSVHAETEVYQ